MMATSEAGGRVFGYVRMSTAKQADSPETQRTVIAGYVKNGGLADDVIFCQDSAKSGTTPFMSRDAGNALLSAMRRGDRLVVTHLDRISRNTRDFLGLAEQLADRGIHLHICNMFGVAMDLSSPMGKLIITMLAGFAQFERDMTSLRTREALAAKKGKNVKHCRFPGYGCKWEVHKVDGKPARVRVRDDDERAIMKRIAQWRLQDNPFTWDEIAENLAKHGIMTKEGKPWDQNRVRRAFAAEMQLRAKEAGVGK
jgi:putative DNA-invertase from lambdoid prophage Rac